MPGKCLVGSSIKLLFSASTNSPSKLVGRLCTGDSMKFDAVEYGLGDSGAVSRSELRGDKGDNSDRWETKDKGEVSITSPELC